MKYNVLFLCNKYYLNGVENMKFDVAVGNPPYQKSNEDTRDDAIYNYFYDLAGKIAPEYALISPGRFLFNAGSTNENWNKKMLSDDHIKVIYYEPNSSKVFENTKINGGIAIVYRNEMKKIGPIGTFTSLPQLNSIIKKVTPKLNGTLDEIISGQGIYKFTKLMHKEHPEVKDILSKSHPNDVGTGVLESLHNILFFEEIPEDGHEYVEMLGRFNNKRVHHWIRKEYVNEPFAFDKYKVIIPKANGAGAIGEVESTQLVGEPLVGEPFLGFTQTFISIGAFDNENEASNLLKYVKTKFARTMLGVLKITQDNPRSKWAKVPMQDFTDNSDINWENSINDIDNQLFEKYNLSTDDISFINKNIKEMN